MVFINYGNDWTKVTYDLLEVSDINEYIKAGMSVAIKPNLVNTSPPSNGATTHPEVVEGIIRFLKDFGIQDIKIMESSAIGYSTQRAYKNCGYETMAKKYGVPLVDLKNSPARTLKFGDMDINIAEGAFETDFLINVPVLKAHCQTRLTCCMKNLKGCIPETEMRRFHTLGLHKPIAALSALLPVHYCVVDSICGDLSFEEGGNPQESNRIIAGRDPVIIDSFCASLIGYQPEDIGYLKLARDEGNKKFFSNSTKIVEINSDQKPKRQYESSRISERYSSKVEDNAACSVCYAALMYALQRSGGTGKRICIGQGFKGKQEDNAIGIGSCTKDFKTHVEGCPPKAVDILKFI